jgi:sigma54-dependent transcription regulator
MATFAQTGRIDKELVDLEIARLMLHRISDEREGDELASYLSEDQLMQIDTFERGQSLALGCRAYPFAA